MYWSKLFSSFQINHEDEKITKKEQNSFASLKRKASFGCVRVYFFSRKKGLERFVVFRATLPFDLRFSLAITIPIVAWFFFILLLSTWAKMKITNLLSIYSSPKLQSSVTQVMNEVKMLIGFFLLLAPWNSLIEKKPLEKSLEGWLNRFRMRCCVY